MGGVLDLHKEEPEGVDPCPRGVYSPEIQSPWINPPHNDNVGKERKREKGQAFGWALKWGIGDSLRRRLSQRGDKRDQLWSIYPSVLSNYHL